MCKHKARSCPSHWEGGIRSAASKPPSPTSTTMLRHTAQATRTSSLEPRSHLHTMPQLTYGVLPTGIARPFRAKLPRRSFATVQDTPVRRYGGLKDQDRIFTNAYCRHDHGIKGATVRRSPLSWTLYDVTNCVCCSPVVTGTKPRRFSSKATLGSFRPSKTQVYVGVEVPVSLVA